jgi:energy-converting hydrogenase Eha subunit H
MEQIESKTVLWDRLQFKLPLVFIACLIVFLVFAFLIIQTEARKYLEQHELQEIEISNRNIIESLNQKTAAASSLAYSVANASATLPLDTQLFNDFFSNNLYQST